MTQGNLTLQISQGRVSVSSLSFCLSRVLQAGLEIWGFPKISGTLFGGPHNKDYSILGSILGSPYFGKLPYRTCYKILLIRFSGSYKSIGLSLTGRDAATTLRSCNKDYSIKVYIEVSLFRETTICKHAVSSQWWPWSSYEASCSSIPYTQPQLTRTSLQHMHLYA